MEIEDIFPMWDKLSTDEKTLLKSHALLRQAKKGDILHSGSADCVGLFVIQTGMLRAYINSSEGREVTLYRLFEGDICLFSASCVLSSVSLDIFIQAEKDSEFWLIPPNVYKSLMESSAAVAGYTNKIMTERFAEVMWLIDKILFSSFDRRLADFILNESSIEQSDTITITHEKIANHTGTAREVVTRMLKYFQLEGIVELSRGKIKITDYKKLADLSK